MPKYKGKYPYEPGVLRPGTLFTYKDYEGLLKGDWRASFHFDEKIIQGSVTVIISDPEITLQTEQEAYNDAVTKGFVLASKEGE